MDSQVKSLQEALEALSKVYDLSPGSRKRKVITLYELASQIKEGSIVELGTYHGLGAITMSMATDLPVYTVDDYTEKHGWAGEKYSMDDMGVFMDNCATLGYHPHLLIRDATNIVDEWLWPVGMIFWDLGLISRNKAADTFLKWDKVLIKDGLYAFHDLVTKKLGYDKVYSAAMRTNRYVVYKDYLDCGIFVLRKTE